MQKNIKAWGEQVTLEAGKATGCTCGWKQGAEKKCNHVVIAERGERVQSAPLNGNRGFSLLR